MWMDVARLYKKLEITEVKVQKTVAKEVVEETKEVAKTQIPSTASNQQDTPLATNAALDHEHKVVQQELIRELEQAEKIEIQQTSTQTKTEIEAEEEKKNVEQKNEEIIRSAVKLAVLMFEVG